MGTFQRRPLLRFNSLSDTGLDNLSVGSLISYTDNDGSINLIEVTDVSSLTDTSTLEDLLNTTAYNKLKDKGSINLELTDTILDKVSIGNIVFYTNSDGFGEWLKVTNLDNMSDTSTLSDLLADIGSTVLNRAGDFIKDGDGYRIRDISTSSTLGVNALLLSINGTSTGENSVALGEKTYSTNSGTLTAGYRTTASGSYSAAVGKRNTASSHGAFVSGGYSTASGSYSTASGWYSTASGFSSLSTGISNTSSGRGSICFGEYSTASGDHSLASGRYATASGLDSFSMGYHTTASGDYSLAFGNNTTTLGLYSFSIGLNSSSNSDYAISLGNGSISNSKYSTTQGYNITSQSEYSYSLGSNSSIASNSSINQSYSFIATKDSTLGTSYLSFIGSGTSTSDSIDKTLMLVENSTVTNVRNSSILGIDITCDDSYNMLISAENTDIIGSGYSNITAINSNINNSFGITASGYGLDIKDTEIQLVLGKYNISDNSKSFIIGAGETDIIRKNIFTIDNIGIAESNISKIDEYKSSNRSLVTKNYISNKLQGKTTYSFTLNSISDTQESILVDFDISDSTNIFAFLDGLLLDAPYNTTYYRFNLDVSINIGQTVELLKGPFNNIKDLLSAYTAEDVINIGFTNDYYVLFLDGVIQPDDLYTIDEANDALTIGKDLDNVYYTLIGFDTHQANKGIIDTTSSILPDFLVTDDSILYLDGARVDIKTLDFDDYGIYNLTEGLEYLLIYN